MNNGSQEEPPPPARGFVVIDKPTGISSRAAVNRVVKLLPKTKVGHAGTLDPLASGVLVLGVGKSTRLLELVQDLPKSYRAVIRLGATSDTLDADGCIIDRPGTAIPTDAQVARVLEAFHGEVMQTPPAYSALKVNGRRAYDLARSGQAPTLAGRLVTFYRCELIRYQWPVLELEIDCGRGTYIRSVAGDIGESLGCGGYIEVLTRTWIGPFRREDALGLDQLSRQVLLERLRPELDAVPNLPRLMLTDDEVAEIMAGRAVNPPAVLAGRVALLHHSGRLIALAEADARGVVHPRKVLG
jgi:tRNA pseudouridine55 synthase